MNPPVSPLPTLPLDRRRVSLEPEEAEWIRAAQGGDQSAFAHLVERYWDRLYRWLYRLTRDRHAAEDLTQETFLKTLAAGPGTVPTAAAGWAVARTILEGWGVQPGALIQRDGSGLTRYDFVTPEALVTILTHVDRDARLRERFEASLPIAGRDGTLANRMKGTAAEGNARAKTGAMTAVRGTSGYVTTADGEPLVFSILVNSYDSPARIVTEAEDAIIVRLAQFHR